jgi:hypothetical protein
MSAYTIIRFPTAAKLGEPMAKRCSRLQLLWRRWFGHRRRHTTANSIRFDWVRRGRRAA